MVYGQAVDGTIVLRVIDLGAWRFGTGDPNRGRGTTVVLRKRGSWSGSTA